MHHATAYAAAAEAATEATLARIRALVGLAGGAWRCDRCGGLNGAERAEAAEGSTTGTESSGDDRHGKAKASGGRCIQGLMHAPAPHLCAVCGGKRPRKRKSQLHVHPHSLWLL